MLEEFLKEVNVEVAKGKHREFSHWHRPDNFDDLIEKMSDDQYPIAIQAGPLEGDGVVYRVLLMDKPTKGLQSEFVYGVQEMNAQR